MLSLGLVLALASPHTFALGKDDFLLDDKPFHIMAGEIHPARIPAEYWRQRIQMVRAMGCNTISSYIFWNYLEPEEGKFDLKTTNHNIAKFLQTCQDEHMWVLLRPGPYCCAEWDFGGLPPYLLKYPDIKVRCMDPRYLKAADRYVSKLASVIKPYLVTNGGPILMVQVENEYGSYGNDRAYMSWVKDEWSKYGVNVPFYTGDGPTTYMLEAGSLPGCAVGLDSGGNDGDWDLARKMNPGVPIFSSETYPGWLTHWGENWAKTGADGIANEVKWLASNKKSFSLYVAHGGTNFGFTAGANSGGKGYEPDVTSYDYDAPISENGNAKPKYFSIRNAIAGATFLNLDPVPAPIPSMSVPKFDCRPVASVWDNLGTPLSMPQPKPFEALGQNQGYMLYRTKLIGHKNGRLDVHDLHDYATVFVDGKYVGKLDRREGVMGIDLPKATTAVPVLDILVEGMGHINFAQNIIDRKGITDRVTLNGMTLMDWQVFKLPMDDQWMTKVKPSAARPNEPGTFFAATFDLSKVADTFFDMSSFEKGVVWINGHNLGRYWKIGPQKRLYCPASWLKTGANKVMVFDMHKSDPGTIEGFESLGD